MPPNGTGEVKPRYIESCRCQECTRHRLTYGVRTFNADGFCEDGYNAEGRDVDGYDRDGYNEDGYNKDGYNEYGYNEDGYNKDGYDEYGYNEDGYNADGYNEDGYNRDGYDREGYNEDGYNRDGYNADGYDRDGNSRGGNCCDSPQQEFAVRNGSETLPCDTRAKIELAAGVISPEGLAVIAAELQSWKLHVIQYNLEEIGDQWQTASGNYTRRLSSYAYKKHGVKVPPAALARVGQLARNHSSQASADIEVTRRLNLSSADFCNDGSCWWGGYASSRCALKTNGGYGLREFDDWNDVKGRAWVMPLKYRNGRLEPTFNALAPDALMTFNGYGSLDGYAAARLLGFMNGWSYKKVPFSCEPMYVNGNRGYLVAPEPLIQEFASGLNLSVFAHASLFASEQAKERETAHASS